MPITAENYEVIKASVQEAGIRGGRGRVDAGLLGPRLWMRAGARLLHQEGCSVTPLGQYHEGSESKDEGRAVQSLRVLVRETGLAIWRFHRQGGRSWPSACSA